jgi:hypothetical protein
MRRNRVEIYLKSGKVVYCLCDDLQIKSLGNQLHSYEFVNYVEGDVFYLRINDISAIQVRRRLIHRILYFWK